MITGLENDFYLSGNPLWVKISNLTNTPNKVEVTVVNITTGKGYNTLKKIFAPDGTCEFNIMSIIEALMPYPDHINNNNLNRFNINLTVKYEDPNISDTVMNYDKQVIRGFRNKNANKEQYLESGSKLVIGKWIEWQDITMPSLPQKIGVYINIYTLTINATPPDAIVKINGVIRNSITVDEGTVVNWSVEREFYTSQSGSETLTENKTLNIGLQPELTSTEIVFKIKTTAANERVPVSLLRTSDTQGVARINYGDGIEETVSVPVFNGSESWTDSEGNIHYIDNGNTFYHVFANPGEYEVNIKTGANISYVRLCESLIQGNDGYMTPSQNNYVIEIVKFRSASLTNLDYTFAGLSRANTIAGFKLETPEVITMNATFYGFGEQNEFTSFPADMLSQITKPTGLRGTFFRSGLKKILPGFLDSFAELITVWECFKNSKLGKGHYSGVDAGTYISQSVEGTNDFIPVSLFWKNPKLKDISHCFNYIGEGYFGNLTSGYLAFHVIRRELLWNGKSVGNTAGTIENAFYAFAKNNRLLWEPNFLKHAPNMVHLGGIFTQTNHTNHAVSWRGIIPVAINETRCYKVNESAGYVMEEVNGKGLTNDLRVIFPYNDNNGSSTYPNILTINGAFTTAATGDTMGVQHNLNFSPNGINFQLSQTMYGAEILSIFPNAKAGSVDASAKIILGQSGGTDQEKSDGRNGAFYMLDQDGRFADKGTMPALVFNNAIPY